MRVQQPVCAPRALGAFGPGSTSTTAPPACTVRRCAGRPGRSSAVSRDRWGRAGTSGPRELTAPSATACRRSRGGLLARTAQADQGTRGRPAGRRAPASAARPAGSGARARAGAASTGHRSTAPGPTSSTGRRRRDRLPQSADQRGRVRALVRRSVHALDHRCRPGHPLRSATRVTCTIGRRRTGRLYGEHGSTRLPRSSSTWPSSDRSEIQVRSGAPSSSKTTRGDTSKRTGPGRLRATAIDLAVADPPGPDEHLLVVGERRDLGDRCSPRRPDPGRRASACTAVPTIPRSTSVPARTSRLPSGSQPA